MNLEQICAQLGRNAQLIQQMTNKLTAEQAHWQPDADSWSVLQVMDLLYREERGDFRAHLAKGLGLPDPSAALPTQPYDSDNLSVILQAFLGERQRSLIWLQDLPMDWDAPCAIEGGTISAGDMLVSWMAHDILHLRQLVELCYLHTIVAVHPYTVHYAGDW